MFLFLFAKDLGLLRGVWTQSAFRWANIRIWMARDRYYTLFTTTKEWTLTHACKLVTYFPWIRVVPTRQLHNKSVYAAEQDVVRKMEVCSSQKVMIHLKCCEAVKTAFCGRSSELVFRTSQLLLQLPAHCDLNLSLSGQLPPRLCVCIPIPQTSWRKYTQAARKHENFRYWHQSLKSIPRLAKIELGKSKWLDQFPIWGAAYTGREQKRFHSE
jgi:hypothetical protein